MAKLRYAMLTSLDGYVADTAGNFHWAAPTEEVHAFINDLERDTGTFLLGRRMYEVLAVWDTMPEDGPSPAVNAYGTLWRAAQKIVYSMSLATPTTKNTEIAHEFNGDAIRRLKAQSEKNLVIGGPQLAAAALQAGLVDELHQFIAPVIVGGGTYWLPKDIPIKLQLVDIQKFEGGVHGDGECSFVYLRYDLLKER